MLKGPLTLVDIVGFYAGRRQVYNVLKLAFAERDRHPGNVYFSPSINYPVHPAAGHFDLEIATEVGMPGRLRPGLAAHELGRSPDHELDAATTASCASSAVACSCPTWSAT